MRYTEALASLIDQQYAEHVEFNRRYGLPAGTATEFAADRINITISRIVGDMVDKATEGAVDFGVFDNCREYGLTFSHGLWTFCVYEHRNSDLIDIEGCPTIEAQDYGPYGSDDKYDTLFCAEYEAYGVVAEKLLAMLRLVSDGEKHTRREVAAA